MPPQRTSDTLERELAHRLDCHRILDRHQHARADQDLTGFGFVAQARGHVGYSADSGIVEAPLEADCVRKYDLRCRGVIILDVLADAGTLTGRILRPVCDIGHYFGRHRYSAGFAG
jgi:hypothetical protein